MVLIAVADHENQVLVTSLATDRADLGETFDRCKLH